MQQRAKTLMQTDDGMAQHGRDNYELQMHYKPLGFTLSSPLALHATRHSGLVMQLG